MPQFIERLEQCGLITAAEVASLVNRLPADQRPTDVKALANLLIRQQKLTKYQATAVYKGQTGGLVIGNYVILDKLGEGGMGQVFKAQHRRMKRLAAIKILPREAVSSPDAVERFRREVEAAAKLEHPNIVTAYDADEAGGIHFLVMQFVDGKDLAVIVQEHGPLPLEQAVDCILQAARGLAFAHENGVVHRDIKPANLLLSKDGVVKILDMGLARLEQNDFGGEMTAARQLTQSGQMMGTVDYMSPEQAEDTRSADHRADIYSLGCTFYRILTGNPAFEGDTVMRKLLAHRSAAIPSLRKARADVPEAIDAVFQKMLSKEPADRQQSMQEVIAEIEAAMAGGKPFSPPVKEDSSSSGLSKFFDQMKVGGSSTGVTQRVETSVDDNTIDHKASQETNTELRRRSKKAKAASSSLMDSLKSKRKLLLAGGAGITLVALSLIFLLNRSDRPVPGDGVRSSNKQDGKIVRARVVKDGGISTAPSFALEFDGVDDYVELPTLSCEMGKPITLEGWVTPFSPDAHAHILVLHGATSLAIQQVSNSWHGLRIRAGTLEMSGSPDSRPAKGQTTHLALAWDGTRQSFWVNGKRASQNSTAAANQCGASGALFGCVRLTDSDPMLRYFFSGQIKEVRVSKTVRYTTDFTPKQRFEPDTDTLALYHFDEGNGRVLKDSSGNNHHGKIFGAKWVRIDRKPNQATGWHGWPADAPEPAIAPFDAAQAKKHQEEWAAYLKVPVEYTNSIGMKFVLIPPGEFMMGSTPKQIEDALKINGSDQDRFERTRGETLHRVILTQPFYLGRHEVTQKQYAAEIGSNPALFSKTGSLLELARSFEGMDTESFPVENVSWNDAVEFCLKLSDKEGFKPLYQSVDSTITPRPGSGYRLPTEAEWEFACRAGSTTVYSSGDRIEDLKQVGWFDLNSGSQPHSVGKLQPNQLGLFDMHGNVWEWVQDWWDKDYYKQLASQSAVDPQGPPSGSQRIVRGSDWRGDAPGARSANHGGINPDTKTNNFGFRVVLTVDVVRAALAKQPPSAIAPFDAAQAKAHQKAWADYLGLPVEKEVSLPGGEKIAMVLIPPGEFMMGSTKEEQARFLEEAKTNSSQRFIEGLQHRVRINKPFYLGMYEVTQAQWKSIMGDNPSQSTDNPMLPVERVSYDDIQPFLAKLNESNSFQQMTFSLPTAAQWEFACRAGTETAFCGGDSQDELRQYGWFNSNSDGRSHPVGELRANAFGLYDVHGNVWEWCTDLFAGSYYQNGPVNDPTGPSAGTDRVFRGGCFVNSPWVCRSAVLDYSTSQNRSHCMGFRLAASIDVAKATTANFTEPPAMPVPPRATAPFDDTQAKAHQQTWAKYLSLPVEKEVDLPGGVKMSFMLIPPGEFLMGSTEEERARAAGDPNDVPGAANLASEGPQHRVQISRPFYLSKYEMTKAQWDAVSGTNTSAGNVGDHPVDSENLEDIAVMLKKLNDVAVQANAQFLLPTEAQWEYACRAGTTTRYSFDENVALLPQYGWFLSNAENRTHPVGRLKPNAWGLYDMHGNVSEWVADWYAEDYFRNSPMVDPTGPANSLNGIQKGGACSHGAQNCRSAFRYAVFHNTRFHTLGFRLAMTIGPAKLPPVQNRTPESPAKSQSK